jgi:hypothetical protein
MANLLLSTRHLVADVFFHRASAHACGRVPPSSPASRCGLLGGRAEAALPLGVALFKSTQPIAVKTQHPRACGRVGQKKHTTAAVTWPQSPPYAHDAIEKKCGKGNNLNLREAKRTARSERAPTHAHPAATDMRAWPRAPSEKQRRRSGV